MVNFLKGMGKGGGGEGFEVMDTCKSPLVSPLRDRIQNNGQSMTSGARVFVHRSILTP